MENEQNKSFYKLPIFFSLIFAFGIALGFIMPKKAERNKFSEIIDYIKAYYVDSINDKKLTEDALGSLMQTLDPHSSYISSKDFNDVNDPLLGSFDGIGVEFNIQKDTVIIIKAIEGGPSEKVGIRGNDRIVKVNDTLIAGKKLSSKDVMKKLKGPKGTKVKVSIWRKGVKNLLNIIVVRGKIPTHSVEIAYMIDNSIGYIRLSKFSETSSSELIKSLESLSKKGMKKLIFDLRGNGGGILDEAVNIANEFLEKNRLIVYTKGRKKPKTKFYSKGDGSFQKGKMVILIDEWSASASEIVAGALQDNDRATIIGKRSFGKGLVQQQLQLSDGSALRITIARYYTPSGRCIQKPYKNGVEEYYINFIKEIEANEDSSASQNPEYDTIKKYRTVNGRTVYGGGGVLPDVVVKAPKYYSSRFFVEIANKGLIPQFAFDYYDNNQNSLKAYNDLTNYTEKFQISKEIYQQFLNFIINKGIKKQTITKDPVLESHIKVQLKAYIGRYILDDEGFYPILNQDDETVTKAINVLKGS